jgi:hypothetical protein
MVEEPNTFIEADDHDDHDGAANAMFDLVDNEDLAEGKEENIQKLKLKIQAMQKANWRLRKQKETLRNQLDNAVSVVQMYCVLIH